MAYFYSVINFQLVAILMSRVLFTMSPFQDSILALFSLECVSCCAMSSVCVTRLFWLPKGSVTVLSLLLFPDALEVLLLCFLVLHLHCSCRVLLALSALCVRRSLVFLFSFCEQFSVVIVGNNLSFRDQLDIINSFGRIALCRLILCFTSARYGVTLDFV